MTKSTKKKKSVTRKKPTAKKSFATKLTGAKATDLYSSLNDSIFQDSFDKFVGDRETRRKQLNLREDVRASFNRNSSLEYSTNDETTDENPPQSYRHSICSTPHMKVDNGRRNLNIYFPGTPKAKAYNLSDLCEPYVESERNGSRVETPTTNPSNKQSNISIYTVGSSVIESSILDGSEASTNINAEETNRNICGKLTAKTNGSKLSSSSSNSSSKAKRKVSSKKQVSSYKWEPHVTTRKHQKLIHKKQILNGLNSLVSLDDQQLESISITSQEQSSLQSNYVYPVGRILRSSSRKGKLSASNFSSSNGSYSTDTSSHSSSNMLDDQQLESISITSQEQSIVQSDYVYPVGRILRSSSRNGKLSASNFSSSNGSYSTDTSSHSSSNMLDDQQLESISITSQEQSSVQSDYVYPVGRILRSSSRNGKLSASNVSSSNVSYSTETSSHSSSNMFSRSGLSETQNVSVSQVAKDKSSESITLEIDCNQNSTQEQHSSIKYDEMSQEDSMPVSISMQTPLAEQSHNFNNVGRILRGSTKRRIRANESISSQSQNSSANLDTQGSDCQILAQAHPYQKKADTPEVRLSMPIMSPEQSIVLITNRNEVGQSAYVQPYQKKADTSIAAVRLSMPIMSPEAQQNVRANKFSNVKKKVVSKKPAERYKWYAPTSKKLAKIRYDEELERAVLNLLSKTNEEHFDDIERKRRKNHIFLFGMDSLVNKDVDSMPPVSNAQKSVRANKFSNLNIEVTSEKSATGYLFPEDSPRRRSKLVNNVLAVNGLNSVDLQSLISVDESQSKENIQTISSSGKDKSVNCKDSESKALTCKESTTSNESSGQLMEIESSALINTKVSEKSADANNSQTFLDITNSTKENLPRLMNNQDGLCSFKGHTSTFHDRSAVSTAQHSVSASRRQSKENIQPMTNDTTCSTGNDKSVNCSKSTELRLKNRNVMCSNNITLRKRHPTNVNNLPVIMESSDVTNEDIATCTLTNDITRKEIQITEINETTSNVQENTIRLSSGKWRRKFSIYHRQTLPTEPAFILEQTDVESTNQLKISLPNESHRQTLRHSVSFNLSRDTFVDFNETSERRAVRRRRTSVLNPIGVGRLIDSVFSPITYNARDTVLRKCQQSEPLEFDEIYSESALRKCRKIGEGVYGEVFMNKTDAGRAVVLKIIPIEGFIEVNGEQQKKFDEILSEIIIALELSSLRNDKEFMTSSFTEVVQVRCVQGRYPEHLIDLWELYRDNYQTENDHPEIFTDDQLYIVLELANGGQDLEAFNFANALQSKSALQQTTLALAVAEKKFQFEHRDLHWGNILLAPTDDKFINFKLNGNLLQIPSEGIKVTIIDYTLSRMRYENSVLYNDLSNDNELFTAHGDYQFDIYRLMKGNLDNDWSRFEPFNNVLWLHYITDKLINGARYKNGKSRKHRSAIEQLMGIRDDLTNYKSAEDSIAAIV